ncbi:unnamed protein product (macronuclear) [Paramecium tetraurelia]|uniref:Uncharacterized protein n=1 Tax=Paramecium tetraurelia TaxID=5888 RepID=A0D9P8_PARTE|nr:uncharacterized protein GSPATT00014696001 [Paramecium tetraurelia]CAK79765.1 unnamed protein product [Paramecium tetraurelia]|eukprot:XP_001447162.1 hypothetical protein (macronuclear) [Paramecium tetraurelia strain d4-2]
MLAQSVQGQLQGPRLSAGPGQNVQMGLGMIQPTFGLQQQNSQQTFVPLSAQLPFPGVGQYKGQLPLQFSMPLQGVNQGQLSQHLINYQQQPLVVQNLIQPQPQVQYQQQIVQPPPLQITQPAQIERKVNYIPQKKQIVKMEEQEIEEIVPVERTIVEYIPVQTIIEKVPIPVEIPYEVMVPKPYKQEIKYPNQQNQFITDDMGNPLSNPEDLYKNKVPPTQITGYQQKVTESDDGDDDDQTDEDDDELIEKYTRIIEEIKQRRRRRRHKQGLSSDDEDDFNFSKFQSKFGPQYGNQGGFYESRYGNGGGGSRQSSTMPNRGYHGRDKSARDYLNQRR